MSDISKAIIPVAGRGTRFLPLSKVWPKELFPLGDKPLIYYAVAEAKAAGAEHIIFVTNSTKKFIGDFFKRAPQLEKVLEEKQEHGLLEELKNIESLSDRLSFSFVSEPKPLGDGHAVLQARRAAEGESCYVLYPDDVMLASVPVLSQMEQMYKTSQRPILALAKMPREKIPSYGVIDGEKITNRVYKIKKIIEKPKPEEIPSPYVIAGRSIITPDVFDYLKKQKPNRKGEISLTETFGKMALDGQVLYGNEFEGRWLECGTKHEWMKSFLEFALSDPVRGRELRQYIRERKLV